MRTRPLVILGTGRIGRALLRQLRDRAEHVRERYDLALPVAALANSRYLCYGAPYLSPEQVASVAEGGLHDGESAPAERAAQLHPLRRSGPGEIGFLRKQLREHQRIPESSGPASRRPETSREVRPRRPARA